MTWHFCFLIICLVRVYELIHILHTFVIVCPSFHLVCERWAHVTMGIIRLIAH